MTDTAEESGVDRADPAQPGGGNRVKQSGFDRFSDDYGIVLILILITIVLAGLFAGDDWARPVIVFVMGITLQVGLAASRVGSRQHRYAGALSTMLVVMAAVGVVAQVDWVSQLAAGLMAGVLMVLLPAAIVRGVIEHTEINIRTVAGALCIYLLLGLFFAFLYMTIEGLGGAFGATGDFHFFAQDPEPQAFDFIYFSFITVTTVGYGDLTAAGETGRMLAILEALIGQIYLVTIVALLVGNLGRVRQRNER
jgi:uncharacterized membrane protein